MAGYSRIYYKNPPIGSVASLCKILEITPIRLTKIIDNIDNFYSVFDRTVKNKSRTLCDPKTELKRIQRRIISRIFCAIDFPSYLHGGIKSVEGRDFVSNARFHSMATTAIAMDIKNFFPSITIVHVEQAFKTLFKFPVEVSEALARLTTLNDRLPQGAPTSSYISNFVMHNKEYALVKRLEMQGLKYSRLIDDITISSAKSMSDKTKTAVTTSVIKMLHSYGFENHEGKYKIYNRSNPEDLMVITGLWINRGAPRIDKNLRESIAKEVVSLKDQAAIEPFTTSDDYHDKFNSISGKVALLERLKHVEATRLRMILRGISPSYDSAEISRISKVVQKFGKTGSDRSKAGYIRKFYRLQRSVGILKQTSRSLGKVLQRHLNKIRPTKTLKETNG